MAVKGVRAFGVYVKKGGGLCYNGEYKYWGVFKTRLGARKWIQCKDEKEFNKIWKIIPVLITPIKPKRGDKK